MRLYAPRVLRTIRRFVMHRPFLSYGFFSEPTLSILETTIMNGYAFVWPKPKLACFDVRKTPTTVSFTRQLRHLSVILPSLSVSGRYLACSNRVIVPTSVFENAASSNSAQISLFASHTFTHRE